MDKELMDAFKLIADREEKELADLSNLIDEIVENNIQNERTISEVFDLILSIVFIDDDEKRNVFHKLSNYCRSFNKELADDYDEILEEDLADTLEEKKYKIISKVYELV